ncbi:MAG: nucleotidyltransferase domain-containing protein [Gammaproteobacteria bacterium]|nr:nucleotidyltransferase domain-containing protein [Gammaproteobacteria bacterium]
MLNLDEKYIKMIKEILSEHISTTLVWAYGSRVKNHSHQGSDLDLVIFPGADVKPETISTLREVFTDSELPILVDILDWNTIPDSFKQEINKEHFVLQNPKMF